jgi:hypothetical protein
MPLHRRFTARNALLVLLAWLFVGLLFHLSGTEKQTPAITPSSNGKGTTSVKGGGKKGGKRRTAVVVASQQDEDSSWLEEYFPHWEKNIYKVDDATAKLTVEKNKGRESMVYLT